MPVYSSTFTFQIGVPRHVSVVMKFSGIQQREKHYVNKILAMYDKICLFTSYWVQMYGWQYANCLAQEMVIQNGVVQKVAMIESRY